MNNWLTVGKDRPINGVAYEVGWHWKSSAFVGRERLTCRAGQWFDQKGKPVEAPDFFRLNNTMKSSLTWEQKLSALSAIADTSLRMREPGDWYVSATEREVVGEGILGGDYGNGVTPSEAVDEDWRKVAESGETLRIRGGRRVRWTGFMWYEVQSV